MKKALGFISSTYLYLSLALSAFAQPPTPTPTPISIPLEGPAGSVPDIAAKNIPQFAVNILFILGIIFAISYLIYGGIRWILSKGDKTRVEEARSHIVASLIGLVIVAAAFVFIALLFQFLGTPNPLTQGFCIPTLTDPTAACPTKTPTR